VLDAIAVPGDLVGDRVCLLRRLADEPRPVEHPRDAVDEHRLVGVERVPHPVAHVTAQAEVSVQVADDVLAGRPGGRRPGGEHRLADPSVAGAVDPPRTVEVEHPVRVVVLHQLPERPGQLRLARPAVGRELPVEVVGPGPDVALDRVGVGPWNHDQPAALDGPLRDVGSGPVARGLVAVDAAEHHRRRSVDTRPVVVDRRLVFRPVEHRVRDALFRARRPRRRQPGDPRAERRRRPQEPSSSGRRVGGGSVVPRHWSVIFTIIEPNLTVL
jgi:hypothetical protein